MSERNVPFERTQIDMQTYARAFIRAWFGVFESYPTKEQAGVFWAQYGIETGAGPWCWNWNIGNVKHVKGDGYDYMMLPDTFEFVNGKKLTFQPPDPATWFRAYANLDEAMHHHFEFLRKRYASCWEAVEAGDCTLFAHRLKAGRDGKEGTNDDYFTGDVNDYANGMLAHFRRWMAKDSFERALQEVEGGSDTLPPTMPDLSTVSGYQEALAELAYDVGTADGIAGSKTVEAVKQFQTDHGLDADGKVGPKTQQALLEELQKRKD